MNITYLERKELEILSVEASGRKCYWKNKLVDKRGFTDFNSIKLELIQIKANNEKLIAEMKASVESK